MKKIIALLCICQFAHAQDPGFTPFQNQGTAIEVASHNAKKDATPPSFTCPSPQIMSLTAGCNVVVPNHIAGLTTLDGSAAIFQQFPAAGTVIPSAHNSGETVLIRATDAEGNVSECSVIDIAKDLTPPTITCHGDVVFPFSSRYECAQFALFDPPTYSDNCPGAKLETNIPRGSYLPPGTYTSTWTVTDQGGNTASCSFNFTIIDLFVPEITCPYNTTQTRTVNAGSCSYLVHGFEFDATAYDNCGYTLTYSLSGATTGTGSSLAGIPLNRGTTTIKWTASDAQGNVASCSFNVVVGTSVDVVIPDAYAYSSGVDVNTIYTGWDPASKLNYTATASGGGTPYSYSWSAATGLNIVGAGNLPTVQVTSSLPGTYLLTLTVTDGNGCQKTITKTVTVVSVLSGASMNKITLCYFPPGNPNSPVTIHVSPNAVANLLGNAAVLGPCPQVEARPGITLQTQIVKSQELLINASPNPSASNFRILISGDHHSSRISLRIVTLNGQVVEMRNNVPTGVTLVMGNTYKPGIYFAEVVQGGKTSRILLVKQ